MNTAKSFILIVATFILLLIFVIGFKPFSFGDAYFRPRNSPSTIPTNTEVVILPEKANNSEDGMDR